MIIRAFLNAHGVKELIGGGTAEGRSNAQGHFLIETLIDTHEYTVSPAIDAVNGVANFTFGKKESLYSAQQAKDQKGPETKAVVTSMATAVVPVAAKV